MDVKEHDADIVNQIDYLHENSNVNSRIVASRMNYFRKLSTAHTILKVVYLARVAVYLSVSGYEVWDVLIKGGYYHYLWYLLYGTALIAVPYNVSPVMVYLHATLKKI